MNLNLRRKAQDIWYDIHVEHRQARSISDVAEIVRPAGGEYTGHGQGIGVASEHIRFKDKSVWLEVVEAIKDVFRKGFTGKISAFYHSGDYTPITDSDSGVWGYKNGNERQLKSYDAYVPDVDVE